MNSDRCVIISTDGHCGADIYAYRDYLEGRFHDDFDAWAATYSDPWSAIDEEMNSSLDRIGVSSFMSPYNWDSGLRQGQLESQGIAAEVLFPNTVPPFQPSGAITAPGPTSQAEYERRLAGVKAHNRWLADFCSKLPGRRAGVAQLLLNDVDEAVREVRWAKEHGLMGVLLPADHFHRLVNLYYPEYLPFWAACADVGLPVHRHGVVPAEAASDSVGVGAPAIGLLEAHYFSTRAVAHLVLSGVFEKFPDLKFVLTETTSAWMGPYMETLDKLGEQSRLPGTVPNMFAGAAYASLPLKPSEYIRRNCYIGSFFSMADIEQRHVLGVNRLMFGADFPHHEGTSPFTSQALRINFAQVSIEETRQMLSTTAAECYGFDLGLLQEVADRIGPLESEIQTPLSEEEWPNFPHETVCTTFAPVGEKVGGAHGSF